MIQFSEHYIYHPNQCQGEDSVVNMEMYFSPSTHSGGFCARIFSLYTEDSLIKMAIRCRYCKCLMYPHALLSHLSLALHQRLESYSQTSPGLIYRAIGCRTKVTARTTVSLGHPSLHLGCKPKCVVHETLTALVSVEVDFLSDAAKATKGNALVNRIFWACQQKKGISPFSVQGCFFPCKEGVWP